MVVMVVVVLVVVCFCAEGSTEVPGGARRIHLEDLQSAVL
jgi:hypothetical protein